MANIATPRASRSSSNDRGPRPRFDTKVNGKFDEKTRAVITRWQAARGYPKTGFLNKLPHKELQSEIVAIVHRGGGGGPGGLFGGMMRPLFGR